MARPRKKTEDGQPDEVVEETTDAEAPEAEEKPQRKAPAQKAEPSKVAGSIMSPRSWLPSPEHGWGCIRHSCATSFASLAPERD